MIRETIYEALSRRGIMDKPVCELCGESEATVQMEDVAVCDDCAATECRRVLHSILGKRCCHILRQGNGELAVCLSPYGIEHAH